MILQELQETYKIQLRANCEVLEVLGSWEKRCDEWDRVLEGLGTLRSQHPREEMARFTQCV